ncbi:hypothetical protein ACFV9E_09230 [Streptomyces sp. NPDC059835]|uniref:hypothetical protein n=1 Tax=unclassified Streptomyces TaxID=2593676 RepID=UPI0036610F30
MWGLARYLIVRPTVSATRKILFSASFFAILLVPCGVSPRYAAASPAVAPPRSYVWIAQ